MNQLPVCTRCGEAYSIGHHCPDQRPKGRDPLLAARQKTHGDFLDNARISQGIKAVLEAERTYPSNVIFREAIDMIALKLSRICSGQAHFRDHWDDIAGYAKLASEACDE